MLKCYKLKTCVNINWQSVGVIYYGGGQASR